MKTYSKQWLASAKKLVIPSIGVVALIAFSFFVIYEATKVTVNVSSDEEQQVVKTHANTVGELLEELEIEVGPYDKVSPSIATTLEKNMDINHKKAKQLSFIIDEEEVEYYTTADTVGEFLHEENLTFSEHDIVSFKEEDEIVEGLTLTATIAYQVTINDAGEKSKIWTTGGKVADLLAENKIKLKKHDKIKPNLDKNIKKGSSIQITRVDKEKATIEETLEFATQKREDKNLEKGKEVVVSEGKNGLLVKTYEVTKENGKEVERELVGEEVKEEPKDRVIAVGTKSPPPPKQNLVTLSHQTKQNKSKQNSNNGNIPNGKLLIMNEATAYSADCKGCSGITAYGINLKSDRNAKVISVDPSVIPLGTKVWVEGYGYAIAGDTGGAIKGKKIDLHMPSRSDALRFGRKHNIKVVILE